MNESKREKNARILPFKNKAIEDEMNVSEVTRNLFTDAWQTYLDQTSMAAVKLGRSIKSNPKKELGAKKAKLSIV